MKEKKEIGRKGKEGKWKVMEGKENKRKWMKGKEKKGRVYLLVTTVWVQCAVGGLVKYTRGWN